MSTGMIGCRGGGIPEEPEKILQKVRKLERFYRVREGTFGWCGRRDSNPHSCRGSDFKLATQGLTQHHGASSNELGTSAWLCRLGRPTGDEQKAVEHFG